MNGEKHRVNGDPTFLKRKNTKSRHARKSRMDGGFTSSEQRVKEKLMRQFIQGYDGPRGNSAAYLKSGIWCSHPGCCRMNGTHSHEDLLADDA